MIVDTTFLVDVLRGKEAALKCARAHETESILWVPSPAVFELWEGSERADRPERERQAIREVLHAYTLLEFDAEHAERAGVVSGSLIRRGQMIDPIDAQIAGMALVEGRPVLTRNVRHFDRVPDLQVETY